MNFALNSHEELLTRGVVDIIDKKHFQKKLCSSKKLRIKLGIDPTGPDIHIGRGATMKKLAEFQELGHTIVLIIGDATARIGDSSDKNSARPMLTDAEIKTNEKKYLDQIGRLLDISKVEVRHNSEWLDSLTPEKFVRLMSLFTVQQMIERENFSLRIKNANPVGLHELMYPIFQGYDSVEVQSDLEIGGTDQLFNLMTGRRIQECFGQEPQDIMTLQLIAGTDGRKMSTSWGNVILFIDEPQEKFGKIMRIADQLIPIYMECATRIPMKRVQEVKSEIDSGKINPMEFKKELAYEIVKLYDGENNAKKAQQFFESTVQKREIPTVIPCINTGKAKFLVSDLISYLVKSNTIKSKNEGKRLLAEGAMYFEGKKISDNIHALISLPPKGGIVKAGKRRFLKLLP